MALPCLVSGSIALHSVLSFVTLFTHLVLLLYYVGSSDPGIGIEAAKIVSECIHSSRVKEMGDSLLRKNSNVEEEDDDVLQSYDRLSDDEVKKYQLKLARSLVVFMELLHLLIARNRDLLLDALQTRKKAEPGGPRHGRDVSIGTLATLSKPTPRADVSIPGTVASADRPRDHHRGGSGTNDSTTSSQDGRSREDVSSTMRHNNAEEYAVPRKHSLSEDDYGGATVASAKDPPTERGRTDAAIGIQRELQLAFISLAKDLYPMIRGIMESDTPRWLKMCCSDTYFSQYTYRQTKIRKFRNLPTSSLLLEVWSFILFF
jgi:hypothetical protein